MAAEADGLVDLIMESIQTEWVDPTRPEGSAGNFSLSEDSVDR